MTVGYAQFDIVLSARHQPEDDNDSFIGFLVDPQQDSLPRGRIHFYGQALCEGVRYCASTHRSGGRMLRGREGLVFLGLEKRLESRIKRLCSEGRFERESGGDGRDLIDGESEATNPRANRVPLISRFVHD